MSAFRRPGTSTSEETPAIERAANRALTWMEGPGTGRKLGCRTFRDAVTLTGCSVAADAVTLTGTGFTSGIYPGDAVVGTGLQPETVVVSVESNTSATLNKSASAEIVSAPLTFGSERLQLSDFEVGHELWIPETPVKTIYSIVWLDSAGSETAFDTTGARLEKDSGRYYLPNGWVTTGCLDILVSCRAGYSRPTATDRGDSEFWALQGVQMRLAQIFFDDERRNPGRALSRQLVTIGSTIPGFKMPDDVLEALAPFRRRG